jgi:hypothetical protein
MRFLKSIPIWMVVCIIIGIVGYIIHNQLFSNSYSLWVDNQTGHRSIIGAILDELQLGCILFILLPLTHTIRNKSISRLAIIVVMIYFLLRVLSLFFLYLFCIYNCSDRPYLIIIGGFTLTYFLLVLSIPVVAKKSKK